jgi:hypothetical protein
MWMWDGWERLVEIESPNRIDKIMVAAGLTSSVSEATRLVKGNGVKIKPWLYVGASHGPAAGDSHGEARIDSGR